VEFNIGPLDGVVHGERDRSLYYLLHLLPALDKVVDYLDLLSLRINVVALDDIRVLLLQSSKDTEEGKLPL
jgi:hypothetical protein